MSRIGAARGRTDSGRSADRIQRINHDFDKPVREHKTELVSIDGNHADIFKIEWELHCHRESSSGSPLGKGQKKDYFTV